MDRRYQPAPEVDAARIIQDCDQAREMLRRKMTDFCVAPKKGAAFNAIMSPRTIDDVRIMDISGSPAHIERGPASIAMDKQTYIGVHFQRKGHSLYDSHGHEAMVGPGDVLVWCSEMSVSVAKPDDFHKLCMLIPFDRIAMMLPDFAMPRGVLLKAAVPMTRLLGGWLSSLSDFATTPSLSTDGLQMDSTFEVVATVVAAHAPPAVSAGRHRLFREIVTYMEKNLDNWDLSPASVASGFNISVRLLYSLFSEQHLTVSTWIRNRRLERCRDALSNYADLRSITEIAFAWGFGDAAHFSRLFKSRYGLSPRAFRNIRSGRTIE